MAGCEKEQRSLILESNYFGSVGVANITIPSSCSSCPILAILSVVAVLVALTGSALPLIPLLVSATRVLATGVAPNHNT